MAFNLNNNGEDAPMADINVIPLVDIMLVLLIISMVTAPFLEQGVNVELPVASGQNLQKTQVEAPVVLFISKDRNLRLGETSISRSQLPEKLASVFRNRSGAKELFVRADKEVPYGVVAEVMARVQAAGIERVGLVTLPDPQQ